MTQDQKDAQAKTSALHDEEERQKEMASRLPEGEEKDAQVMKGERLSDEAWAIEEANDLDPRPSGIWPKAG